MSPHTRNLLDELFATEAMAGVFSDRARVQGMLDFEAALAHAEAECGVIAPSAATAIALQCRAQLFDLDALAKGAAVAGNLAIPVIKALTVLVAREDAEASRSVHWGATSQDAIDTGLVLQLRRALELIDADLARLARALADLARVHQRTVMLGRTWLQPAPPVTVGLKAAGWLSALERQRNRLAELRTRVLVVQLGGAVGTLASLGGQGLAIAARLSERLGLGLPDLPWHAERDRIAEVGATLGLLAGCLGKMGRDLSLMMQFEVAEAFEPRAPGRGGSSTMPHKHNPLGAAVMLAAAARVPPLVATLFAAMPQEHERGLGGWHAEWECLPEICLLTSGTLARAVEIFEKLEVDPRRMRANLAATDGVVLAEPVTLALARHLDRATARDLIERACVRAVEVGLSLREALSEEPQVTAHLSAADLDRLCDPGLYLGLSEKWVERVLTSYARRRDGTGS